MRKLFAVSLILMLAGIAPAFAQKGESGTGMLMSYTAEGSTVANPPDVEGVPDTMLQLDISGTESWDLLDDPSNTVLVEAIGAGAIMTGVGWDVTISTVGASWLSEAVTYFDGEDLDGMGLFLTPGVGDGMPGSATYSSGGILDLTDNGIPNIPVGADQSLYLQFFESFDDVSDAVDATWDATSTYDIAGIGISIGGAFPVPTLSTIGLITLLTALAGVGVFLLRR